MVKLLAQLAPAKINLFLRVVGQRSDGYHELDSVFLPISLYDRIQLEVRPSRSSSVALRCDRGDLPSDDRNLASRAASAFIAEFGIAAEILIDLHKEIPVGAGLGGGSSDAGAVLRMMAALYRTGDAKRLSKLALKLGADVPFFLEPRPARVGGIGERIAPLKRAPSLPLVIAVPPFEVSTADIYGSLRSAEWSGAVPEADMRAIESGQISPATLVNDLEQAAIRRHPRIGELKALLQDVGASAAAMTGSGGAVFGVFQDAEAAARGAEKARQRAPDSQFVTAISLS